MHHSMSLGGFFSPRYGSEDLKPLSGNNYIDYLYWLCFDTIEEWCGHKFSKGKYMLECQRDFAEVKMLFVKKVH